MSEALIFESILMDGKNETPKNGIYYLIGSNGQFIHKENAIMESVVKVEGNPSLEKIEPSLKWKLPKLPKNIFSKTASFFLQVYEMYKAEAIVLLFYNFKDSKFKLYCPIQKVGRGSADYINPSIQDIGDYIYIGDIHSHASMSAFHSGTDDKDDGDGIHITIGDIDRISRDNCVSISCSFVSNKVRFSSAPENYIDGIEKMSNVHVQEEKVDEIENEEDDMLACYYGFEGYSKLFRGTSTKSSTSTTFYNDKTYKIKLVPHDSRWIKYVKNDPPIYMNTQAVYHNHTKVFPYNESKFITHVPDKQPTQIHSFNFSQPFKRTDEKKEEKEINKEEELLCRTCLYRMAIEEDLDLDLYLKSIEGERDYDYPDVSFDLI